MSVPVVAGAARIVSSHRTVELLGGQRTRDVYEIGAISTDKGVFFQFRVPVGLQDPVSAGPDALSIHVTADAIAVELESLFSLVNVVGMSYVQDVSPANQLEDLMEIYVASDNGEATDFIRWPLEAVDLRVLQQPILDLVAKLNATVT